MKVNLHTHTYRCGHADGTDEAFVLAAIAAGFTHLGFSDHTPFPYENNYQNGSKMQLQELEGYIASVLALKEKYRQQIRIFLGLECESVPRFFPYLKQLGSTMDYLILGNHGDWSTGEVYTARLETPQQLEKYVQTAVEGMESGLFLYLAHPDLMLCSYPEFDDAAEKLSRQLCREANRLGIPLEYNLYGLQKVKKPNCLGYPSLPFWQIVAEENGVACVGVDAHRPENFRDSDFIGAQTLLRSMGIQVLENPLQDIGCQRAEKDGCFDAE